MTKNQILLAVGLLILCSGHAVTQERIGALQGQVLGPYDDVVRDAPIQVTHNGSGEKWRTRSTSDGRYEFNNLPAGSYQLIVNVRCCAYGSYEQLSIEVSSGIRTSFDVELEEGRGFNTIGDDNGNITAAILREQEVPDLPAPRMPGGQPDLSGMWVFGVDPFPSDAEPFDWAAKLRAERLENFNVGSPRFRCLPPDLPIPSHAAPDIGKFIQTTDVIVILYEGVLGYRQIFLDGRGHPENPNPSWLGHSIGHWEEDVLVVDTMGFNDRGWTSAYPRSEKMHFVERYRRTVYGVMELKYTIEDPEIFQKPWVHKVRLNLAPKETLIEYVCENNQW